MGSHPRLLEEEQGFLVGTEHVLESSISPHLQEPTCVEHTLAFIKQMAHSHTQPSKETIFWTHSPSDSIIWTSRASRVYHEKDAK